LTRNQRLKLNMSTLSTTNFFSHTALLCMLCLAVFFDQRTRKIPNPLVLSGLVCAFVLNIYGSGLEGFKQSLLGALIGFAILVPFFVLRVLGAGDVKLMAVVGAFIGPVGAFFAVLYTMMVGGVLATILLLTRGHLKSTLVRMRNPSEIIQSSMNNDISDAGQPPRVATRLPYSWAILLGTLGSLYSKS
jgi:prepilin peptidase CpaA